MTPRFDRSSVTDRPWSVQAWSDARDAADEEDFESIQFLATSLLPDDYVPQPARAGVHERSIALATNCVRARSESTKEALGGAKRSARWGLAQQNLRTRDTSGRSRRNGPAHAKHWPRDEMTTFRVLGRTLLGVVAVVLLHALGAKRVMADDIEGRRQTCRATLSDHDTDFLRAYSTSSGCNTVALPVKLDVHELVVNTESDYQIDTCMAPNDTDTVLYVYSSAFSVMEPCNPPMMAKNDDGCAPGSKIQIHLTPGTYLIVVAGFWASERGSYSLSVTADTNDPNAYTMTCSSVISGPPVWIMPYREVDGARYVHGVLEIAHVRPALTSGGGIIMGHSAASGDTPAFAGWQVARCGEPGNFNHCPPGIPDECNLDAGDLYVGACITTTPFRPIPLPGDELVMEYSSPMENPVTGKPFQMGEQIAAAMWIENTQGVNVWRANFGGVTRQNGQGAVIWQSNPTGSSFVSDGTASVVGSGVTDTYGDSIIPEHDHSWNAWSSNPQLDANMMPVWSTSSTWATHYCYNCTQVELDTLDRQYGLSLCITAGFKWIMSLN